MKKKRNKKYRARPASRSTFALTIASNMPEQLNPESHRDMMLRAYQTLHELVSGSMDIDGFYLLNGVNVAAHTLAEMVGDKGTEKVRLAMAENLKLTLAASSVLIGIGKRQAMTGRFGASGEELKRLRAMMAMFDTLAEACPTGLVLQALQRAAVELDAADARRIAIQEQQKGAIA